MECESDITRLAEQKLNGAECLFSNKLFDDAYYLAGYSFELLLKAKICKTLSISDFFGLDKNKREPIFKQLKDEAQKPFKVHDYTQLIILSGLYSEFLNEMKNNKDFSADWSTISRWNENCRYKTGISEKEIRSFIDSLINMQKWIIKFL